MPSPTWEDLTPFFDVADFATSAVITFQAGGTRTVKGIFDDPYLAARLGGFDRDDNHVTLTIKETDSSGIKRGDTVVVNSQTFDVMTTPQGDGTGVSIIALANQ